MILNLLNEIEMDIDSVMPIVFEAIRKYGRPPAEFSGYLDEFYIILRDEKQVNENIFRQQLIINKDDLQKQKDTGEFKKN